MTVGQGQQNLPRRRPRRRREKLADRRRQERGDHNTLGDRRSWGRAWNVDIPRIQKEKKHRGEPNITRRLSECRLWICLVINQDKSHAHPLQKQMASVEPVGLEANFLGGGGPSSTVHSALPVLHHHDKGCGSPRQSQRPIRKVLQRKEGQLSSRQTDRQTDNTSSRGDWLVFF